VPVTLKLSKQFYDKFGEQVANELVDAFNQVDATYRSDLKEMNESNFARFDAKLEARFAQFDAKLDARFAQFEIRFAQSEAKVDARIAQSEATMERRFGDLYRFMLLGWATVLAAIVGGIFALK
jgi:hypothetical protein